MQNNALHIRILLINLLIVGILGLTLRFGGDLPFPGLNPAFIRHSHSHFAFMGWLTQSLLFLIITLLRRNAIEDKRNTLLYRLHLVCAYSILISFAIQGYAFFSIFFSTVSVIITTVMTVLLIRQLRTTAIKNQLLITAALLFGVFSTLGTFALGFSMATKQIDPILYQGYIYFYLHFQYNGWFLLASLGLLSNLPGFNALSKTPRHILFLLIGSVLLTFSLSILALNRHPVIVAAGIVSALLQLVAFGAVLFRVYRDYKTNLHGFDGTQKFLLALFGYGLMVKIVLQLLSSLPVFYNLAFQNRTTAIAYLHWTFLVVLTGFILFALLRLQLIRITLFLKTGIIITMIACILNSVVTGLSGLSPEHYSLFQFLLKIIGILLVSGILCIVLATRDTGQMSPVQR